MVFVAPQLIPPHLFWKSAVTLPGDKKQNPMARYGLILGQRKVSIVRRTSLSLAIATANKT